MIIFEQSLLELAKEYEHDNNARIVQIYSAFSTEQSLVNHISESLNSPYKDDNWDGFRDMLCDLHWLNENRIILVHSSLPDLDARSMKAYISILFEVSEEWDCFDERAEQLKDYCSKSNTPLSSDSWIYHKKQFDVLFDEHIRNQLHMICRK